MVAAPGPVNAVVGVDPGLLSGVAWRCPGVGGQGSSEVPYEEFGSFMAGLLDELAAPGHRVVVACESFVVTAETGKLSQAPWSLKGIGILEFLCQRSGAVLLPLQSPSDAKGFCDNGRLRALGLWHVGGEGHANDAFRHLALALVKLRDPWITARLTELAEAVE